MNGSPLYRAHARLSSPVFLPLPSPGEHKTEPETEPFTKLTVESSVTPEPEHETEPVRDLSTDLSVSETSTQVSFSSRVFMTELIMWCGLKLKDL